jgi:pimeloyl-ACP methyl ester carboxylesterase
MFRMRAPTTKSGAKVVFFQHGLFNSAMQWIMHSKDKAPAFKLASQGYDVWFGNNRGNSYSRKHESLDPMKKKDMAKYFDYSFVELGDYDLPAQIDKVLYETGEDKLTYVGHSQGTSQMFYALAMNEDEMKDKINLFVACSPVMRLGLKKDRTTKFVVDEIRHGIEDWLKSEYLYEIGGDDKSKGNEKLKKENPDFYALVMNAAAELGSSEYNDPEVEVISFNN